MRYRIQVGTTNNTQCEIPSSTAAVKQARKIARGFSLTFAGQRVYVWQEWSAKDGKWRGFETFVDGISRGFPHTDYPEYIPR